MSFGLQHGHIGQKQINEAIEELEGNSFRNDEYIYVQRKAGNGGNSVRGQWYSNVEDLTDDSINEYTLESYKEDMELWDEDYIFEEDETDFIDELKDGKTIYTICDDGGNTYWDEDKATVVLESISDGEIFLFSYNDAMENLKGSFLNESLVIWLLK